MSRRFLPAAHAARPFPDYLESDMAVGQYRRIAFRVKTDTVIGNLDMHALATAPDDDLDVRGAGMLANVGQAFLNDVHDLNLVFGQQR